MLNLSNEAIRRMYLACKDNDCFPGELPLHEHNRNVSIHAILGGLGLLTDGMLSFDTPNSLSDESSWRRPLQSNAPGHPPRANSGSCNPSMDVFDTPPLHNAYAFPSSNSAHSSTSHHSFDDPPMSPMTEAPSFDCVQSAHYTGPPFLHNLDFLSFGPQNTSMPMISPPSTNRNVMQPLRNNFVFPWPGTFAPAMDTTEYHHQQQ